MLVAVMLVWSSSLAYGLTIATPETMLEGPGAPLEEWSMKSATPYTVTGATTLANPVPEYHWWLGCSPTAAGMLFSYWDTYLGKDKLYDGDSSNWDKVNMDKDNPAHYDNEHNIVASWEHRQAGLAKGLSYGSWDRNGNGIVDQSDRDQWNSLADFMQTEDGGTYRSNMAQGFMDYAMWDNPDTAVSESYNATSSTLWDTDATWAAYIAEIDAGRPVHVGISGHSILGLGYWTSDGSHGTTAGENYVVNWTTWGPNNGWTDGQWGLIEFDEVYAFTTLEIGDHNPVIPEPASILLVSLGLLALVGFRRTFRKN
jgi:hypothetical protein